MDRADFNKLCQFTFWEQGVQRYVAGVTRITDSDGKIGGTVGSKLYVNISKWWLDLLGDNEWKPTRKHIFVPADAWLEFQKGYADQLLEVVTRELNGSSDARSTSAQNDAVDGTRKGLPKCGASKRGASEQASEASPAKLQRKGEKAAKPSAAGGATATSGGKKHGRKRTASVEPSEPAAAAGDDVHDDASSGSE